MVTPQRALPSPGSPLHNLQEAKFIWTELSTTRNAGRRRVRAKLILAEETVSTVNPIELTAEIVSAFVSNSSVPPGELSALIQTVHAP